MGEQMSILECFPPPPPCEKKVCKTEVHIHLESTQNRKQKAQEVPGVIYKTNKTRGM